MVKKISPDQAWKEAEFGLWLKATLSSLTSRQKALAILFLGGRLPAKKSRPKGNRGRQPLSASQVREAVGWYGAYRTSGMTHDEAAQRVAWLFGRHKRRIEEYLANAKAGDADNGSK